MLGLVILIFSFTMLVLLVWPGLPAFATLPFMVYAPGMGFIDAYFETLSAMTTAGYFDLPLIEAVLIVFMLLAALNFATHFLAFRQKSLAAYRHDPEVRGVLGLVIASCLGISLYVGPARNYAGLDDFQTWTLAFTMLLGRLELFTVSVLFTRAFWRG